jgi:hypothetical protein
MSEKCDIACARLAFTSEEKHKYEVLKGKIFNSLVRTEELTNGYEFVLNEDINLLHDLADWLPLEHKCCPFLQFTLTLYKDKFIRLQLTGPEEIKGFLIQELELSQ